MEYNSTFLFRKEVNTISNLDKLIKNITEEEFKTKIIENLNSNVSLASLALNVPVCNISSGHFAYAEGIPVIPELEDNIVQELELQLGKAEFNLEEIISYCPISGAILNMEEKGFKELLAKVFAKSLNSTLNKKAWASCIAKKEPQNFDLDVFISAVARIAMSKQNGVIICNPGIISKVLQSEKAEILGVKVLACADIEGILVADLDSALAYVHKNDLEIGYNKSAKFNKNIALATLSHYADVIALDTDSFECFTEV